METEKSSSGWYSKFKRLLTTVLLPGYAQTPARWHKNWFTVFYFIPALPGGIALWLFPTAITPLPTLEQATVYEGTASIWRHPSQYKATIHLVLATGEKLKFGCRDGAMLGLYCLPGNEPRGRSKYEGKPAKVWGAPVEKRYASPDHVAVQIEIDGQIVHSYDWSVKNFNGGWMYSNENIIAVTRLFVLYIVFVLIGFPLLNYLNWKKERQNEEAAH